MGSSKNSIARAYAACARGTLDCCWPFLNEFAHLLATRIDRCVKFLLDCTELRRFLAVFCVRLGVRVLGSDFVLILPRQAMAVDRREDGVRLG